MTCPGCAADARFVTYRPKRFVSLLGDLRLDRGYYHCAACGRGTVPWDAALHLSTQRLTPAAREVVALAGIQESFGKAAAWTLRKLAGLRLSESTVERTTEAAGQRLAEDLRGGAVFGADRAWDWHTDADGRTCAYVSVDATGVLMQGPGGAKADGRMVWVGMIYNPRPRAADAEPLSTPCDGSRYLAGLYTLDDLGAQLRRQAAQVGMDAAEVWVALTDGGNGLERFMDTHFPRAVKILDFHHAAGHLAGFAKLFRTGPLADRLAESWCHTLKHAGGRQVIRVLERLDRGTMTADVGREHERVLNYLRSNAHRTDYPAYLARGWQIASGAVESGCKTVINQRLCQGGMRWGEAGSDQVAHLRALYRSDDDAWDHFWAAA